MKILSKHNWIKLEEFLKILLIKFPNFEGIPGRIAKSILEEIGRENNI